ncbi:hypothetical protein Bbelb_361410 [Branchiostoma belcheri]|nr:hypothetical protein Bbelb_361410 [Branchiostoma belcheri]
MTKPKSCTVCKLPVKRHPGPHGQGKCSVSAPPKLVPRRSSSSDSSSYDQLRRTGRIRRSLQKLSDKSKAKDITRSLWSEASNSDAPSVRDLRDEPSLTKRVDKKLEEIFGSTSKPKKSPTFRRETDTSSSPPRRSPPPTVSKKPSSVRRVRHGSSTDRSVSRPKSKEKGKKSGRASTINDHVGRTVNVSWPQQRVHFAGHGKGGAVTYDDLTLSMFVFGTLKNILAEHGGSRTMRHRLTNLADMMYDATYYDWSVVHEMHASVLYSLENGTIRWSDVEEIEGIRDRHYRTAAAHQPGRARPKQPREPSVAIAPSSSAMSNRPRFCGPFQTRSCNHTTDHYDSRWGHVKHVCNMCLLVRHIEVEHPRAECPHNSAPFRQAPGDSSRRQSSMSGPMSSTGLPNFLGARIPVTSSLNIPAWRAALDTYPDSRLVDFLEFGFPINIQPDLYSQPLNLSFSNHRSALDHPDHVDEFFTTELSHDAISGPYPAKPFPFTVTPVPLQTVEKRGSARRRVVVDLSFPPGRSVNDAIPSDYYLDDFGGAETPSLAQEAFASLERTLSILGLDEVPEKAIHPTTCLTWLGIEFDTLQMIRRVPEFRLLEVTSLVSQWLDKRKATKRELQSLIGKLVFVSACVPPGRLFVSRMLETLRKLHRGNHRTRLSCDFRLDLEWWHRFLVSFNGVSLIAPTVVTAPDEIVATDACSTGCGAFSGGQFFHSVFPADLIERVDGKIHVLEMMAIVIAARKWGHRWAGLRILVHCDNAACVHVLNSGRSRDKHLLQCSRELWFLAASHNFELRASHISAPRDLARPRTLGGGTCVVSAAQPQGPNGRLSPRAPGRIFVPTIDVLETFAEFLGRSFQAPAAIFNYLSGLKTLHVILGWPVDAFHSTDISLLKRGLRKRMHHTPLQVKPFTPEILLRIYGHLDLDRPFHATARPTFTGGV